MKCLFIRKDGGQDSNVTGYWLIESKKLFSIVLLKFSQGSREAYHNHAFNAYSWILYGRADEHMLDGSVNQLTPRIKPYYTSRGCFHKVYGIAPNTWALTFRGPWVERWQEFFKKTNTFVTLGWGRKVLD
jgi:hypothetical protein